MMTEDTVALMGEAIFKAGRQQGAIDFCHFLRSRIRPDTLLEVWEDFNKTAVPAQPGVEPIKQQVAQLFGGGHAA